MLAEKMPAKLVTTFPLENQFRVYMLGGFFLSCESSKHSND